MYEIKSIKDGTYGAYEYSTPIPADYSFKQMLAMHVTSPMRTDMRQASTTMKTR